jgi:hypothetical protein
MMLNAIVNVCADHLLDFALELLKLLRVSGIRNIELSTASRAKIQQGRVTEEQRVNSQIELDVAVIASKASCSALGPLTVQERQQPRACTGQFRVSILARGRGSMVTHVSQGIPPSER